MDFLGAVNRILVNAFILKGDDDLVTTFADTQHEATIRVARNAFSSELNNLLSVFTVPYERTTGSVVTVTGQRVYALPSDFVRFYLNDPYIYLTDGSGQRAVEYSGGEANLRQKDHFYLTQEGFERWWYWADDTVKSIALYQVPDADGREWNFEYQRDVTVTLSTDTIPLQSEPEAQALSDMAARRFKYITEGLNVSDLEQDADYVFSRQTLMNLISNRDPSTRRGFRYRPSAPAYDDTLVIP